MNRVCFTILVILFSLLSNAQERFTGYYEPYLGLEYNITETYSHKFTLENRIRWYDYQGLNIDVTQIDLAHFSVFNLNDKNGLAIGIQYRFKTYFEEEEENKLRFTQEYKYSYNWQSTIIQHRVRAEQRLSQSLTTHRYRYKIKFSTPLKRRGTEIDKLNFIGNLESLLTVAHGIGPKYEQRIGAGIGWALTDFAVLELTTEYRLDDFTENLGHEVFLVTGITFKP